jgi:hypothetical protein
MASVNDISGNNNSENNSSITETNHPLTHYAWMQRSVINKSLFTGEEDITEIIKPKIVDNETEYTAFVTIQARTNINKLFLKESFTNNDLNKFNKLLKRFVWISDGNTVDSQGNEVVGGVKEERCAFDNYPVHSSTSCKKPSLSEKAERFIDIYNNTLVLFYKKVKSRNPDLLTPANWKNISESFTDCIKGIYYFSGLKYLGNRLCEKMSPLVNNINKIFKSVKGGRPILIETGTKGEYSCGRGIIWGSYRTPTGETRDGVFIHQTIGEEDDNVDLKIMTNIPTITVGGSRKLRRNRKRKTLKAIKAMKRY